MHVVLFLIIGTKPSLISIERKHEICPKFIYGSFKRFIK